MIGLVRCVVVAALCAPAAALYEGMYCGKVNCYDMLNVTRETPKKDVCCEL